MVSTDDGERDGKMVGGIDGDGKADDSRRCKSACRDGPERVTSPKVRLEVVIPAVKCVGLVIETDPAGLVDRMMSPALSPPFPIEKTTDLEDDPPIPVVVEMDPLEAVAARPDAIKRGPESWVEEAVSVITTIEAVLLSWSEEGLGANVDNPRPPQESVPVVSMTQEEYQPHASRVTEELEAAAGGTSVCSRDDAPQHATLPWARPHVKAPSAQRAVQVMPDGTVSWLSLFNPQQVAKAVPLE